MLSGCGAPAGLKNLAASPDDESFYVTLGPTAGLEKRRAAWEAEVLVWTDRVTDRSPNAKQIVGAESIHVIHDVIVVNLGADKDMVPDVVAYTSAKIHEEVTGADEIVTAERSGAVGEIEASTLPSEARHQIQADLLAELGLVHGVKVADDGAKGLASRSAVRTLACSPSGFKIEADAFVEDDVGAEAGIQAALLGTNAGIWITRSRGQKSAEAEHGIALLGRSKLCEQQENENGGEQR